MCHVHHIWLQSYSAYASLYVTLKNRTKKSSSIKRKWLIPTWHVKKNSFKDIIADGYVWQQKISWGGGGLVSTDTSEKKIRHLAAEKELEARNWRFSASELTGWGSDVIDRLTRRILRLKKTIKKKTFPNSSRNTTF